MPIPDENAELEVSTAESKTDGLIPVADLIVFEGNMHGQKVTVLKDDGCNTNVVSKAFFRKNGHLFQTEEAKITITHSKRDSRETARQVILNGEVREGPHVYRSNWAVGDCRYDVLLGMPWHKDKTPSVDYAMPSVAVGGDFVPLQHFSAEERKTIRVTNLGVKRFRRLVKKKNKRNDFAVFQLLDTEQFLAGPGKETGGTIWGTRSETFVKVQVCVPRRTPGWTPS